MEHGRVMPNGNSGSDKLRKG